MVLNFNIKMTEELEYKINKLTIEDFIYNKLLNNHERIIVTMTSWKKRIKYVKHVVQLMKQQTLKPYKIILNLSSDEFINKNKDLPVDLLNEIDDTFEIFWVKENTKVYKKVFPTFDRFPNDIIVSVDDDIEYPLYFIEKLYIEFIRHSGQIPITAGVCKWENDIYSHYGGFTMFKKFMFGEYLQDLYENVVLKHGIKILPFADPIFTYAALLNNVRYGITESMNMSEIRKNSPVDKLNRVSNIGNHEYIQTRNNEHNLIKQYIKNKYNKTYSDITKTPIIVNLTTWIKRDKYLPKTLEYFKKQTLKPDKIILWLSEEEYNKNDLPTSIKTCIDKNLISEVRFVKKNIYCHKRQECFKEYNYCYNVFIDDDFLYKPDFLKTLITSAKKYPNCVTCYMGNKISYNGIKIITSPISANQSFYNAFMGGLACFPPFIFPMEAYLYSDLRDKYVTKCDESWLRPLFIKYGIKINTVKCWKNGEFTTVGNSQCDSLWKQNKNVYRNGMREKERNFFNAVKIFKLEEEIKKLWPNISIDSWKLKTSEEM